MPFSIHVTDYHSAREEMSYQAVRRNAGNSNAHHQVEEATWEDSIPARGHSIKGRATETEKRSSLQGQSKGETDGGAAPRSCVRHGEATLGDTAVGERVLAHLSKPTDRATPRVSPHVNRGLQLILMC